ncbi:zinc-binding protein A33-like [Carettochelys insculpta]|uniref:zinc-binding protein A33-like n=1 Tax=Carettochelys insculpta TaxID=44489 RepID=UPI003EBCB706
MEAPERHSMVQSSCKVEDVVCNFLDVQEGVEKLHGCYKKRIQATQHGLQSLREEVMEDFQKMYSFLYAEEQSVLAMIDQVERQVVSHLGDGVKDITKRAACLLELMDYLSEVEDPDGHLMDVAKSQVDQLKDELNQQHKQLRHHWPAVLSSPSLTYMVCKRMLGYVTQSALECLTLDPKTAHSHLQISRDLKSAKLGPGAQAVPENPERFEPCLYVLCSQDFHSGRHYWEVSVGHKSNWVIGVARHGVNRKATEDLNPENGYWALRKIQGNCFYALSSPPALLTLDSSPTKVGVCLDYESGRVGFYDAKSMAEICTLRGDFQEPLHPFFCPGLVLTEQDCEPLRLCN